MHLQGDAVKGKSLGAPLVSAVWFCAYCCAFGGGSSIASVHKADKNTSLSELFFLEFIVGFAYEESHRGIPKKHRCVSMGDSSLERGRNHFGGQKNYLLLHIYSQMGIELTHLCCFLHSIFCGIWGSDIVVADKSLASLVQLWWFNNKSFEELWKQDTQWRVDRIIE